MANSEWLDNMLDPKISKEAATSVGKDAQETFERKVEAHPWVESILELDPVKVEADYQAALEAEAKMLGKTAALDIDAAYEMGDSTEETLKKDYARDVSILSDYALAEMVAGIRGHAEQNTPEKFHDHKEEAKKNIASNRKKVEEEVLKATGTSAQIDWKKEFERYSKEAKPEEPKSKDLYQPIAPEKEHDFDHPSEDKFKVSSDEKKTDVMIGVGREADERKEVTQQAGVLQEDITKGLAKDASQKESHCGMPHEAEPKSPLMREELYAEVEGCPLCGGSGEDLGNLGNLDHMRCRDCGVTYSHKEGSCGHCGTMEDIKSCASKADVIKKISEIESPWIVTKDAEGNEVIARRDISQTNIKESEEAKEDELKK